MTHVDEYKLELFVLNPDSLGGERAGIETHAGSCPGCSLLIEQIRSFYAQAEEAFVQKEVHSAEVRGHSLIPVEEQVPDIFAPVGKLSRRRWELDRRPMFRLMRRHPIAIGSGTFALLAIAAASAFFFVRGARDQNPAYVHLNPAQELVEVYNAGNERLWTLPAEGLSGATHSESSNGMPAVQVADLDGDGRNEVVAVVQLSKDPGKAASPLRVFESDGNERFGLRLGGPVKFSGADYSEYYTPLGIAISGPGADGRREIFVGAANLRSPYVISRVSSSGKILGEYWHFGQIFGFTTLSNQGRESLVAWGTNDMPDTSGRSDRSFAFVGLLDPAKLRGKTESAFTHGFGLPVSEAEERYVRLPRNSLQDLFDLPGATTTMMKDRDSILTFVTSNRLESGDPITFFYSFNKDLEPLQVKSDDVTEALQRRLVAEGKLKSPWTRSYFDSLKARIEFLR